ncbi:hypothetical protein HNP46_006519 [Pseudomonas nitritireducens]|uniref:Uncharacterized protein n=1 Tax=Pseudomonas nitroreducens TaxID=46680 RepID=A0A7W7P5E4_PSENT|nr:hypothetical protein [Pseudomonas nitritireducens]MBB4867605.1 hypothetical protein [Pseudomonas nitritireducens]
MRLLPKARSLEERMNPAEPKKELLLGVVGALLAAAICILAAATKTPGFALFSIIAFFYGTNRIYPALAKVEVNGLEPTDPLALGAVPSEFDPRNERFFKYAFYTLFVLLLIYFGLMGVAYEKYAPWYITIPGGLIFGAVITHTSSQMIQSYRTLYRRDWIRSALKAQNDELEAKVQAMIANRLDAGA